MADPLHELGDVEPALELALAEARRYLATLEDGLVQPAGAAERVAGIGGPLPEHGDGAMAAIRELSELGNERPPAQRPALLPLRDGRRHAGGAGRRLAGVELRSEPERLGGDAARDTARDGRLAWLRELFGLPAEWGGVLTTGATMANFAGLAAARSWWGERHGVDVDERRARGPAGRAGDSRAATSTRGAKALAMLGIGRKGVTTFSRDDVGRVDLTALERALKELDGAPAILIANAGEVNSGDFDPIDAMADLAEAHGAWLHVDGAFGLFARATPQAAGLAAGVERADSVISDGHKWLNVPYDCGFAFVRESSRLVRAFTVDAAYLPPPGDQRPNYGFMGPETSRRARAFAVWATLRAYGRDGHRAMVERHLGLARRLGGRVEEQPELELLAEAEAEHRLLPPEARRSTGGRAGRAEPPPRRDGARGRPGLLRHHRVRRARGLQAGDRELADHRARRGPSARCGARAGSRAAGEPLGGLGAEALAGLAHERHRFGEEPRHRAAELLHLLLGVALEVEPLQPGHSHVDGELDRVVGPGDPLSGLHLLGQLGHAPAQLLGVAEDSEGIL